MFDFEAIELDIYSYMIHCSERLRNFMPFP